MFLSGMALFTTEAIGIYAVVASSGASIGLLVGGVLTQAINWHWIRRQVRSRCGR